MTMCRKALLGGVLLTIALAAVIFAGACDAEDPKPGAGVAAAPGKVHACAGADRWFPGDGDRLGSRQPEKHKSVEPLTMRPRRETSWTSDVPDGQLVRRTHLHAALADRQATRVVPVTRGSS